MTAHTPWNRQAVAGFAGGHRVTAQLGFSGDGLLYHFGARYYKPFTARWTQQDPLNQVMDLREANSYVYAGGDPVNSVDRLGLERCADYGYTVGELRFCNKPMSETEKDVHECVGAGAIGGAFGGPKGAAERRLDAPGLSCGEIDRTHQSHRPITGRGGLRGHRGQLHSL